VVEQLVKRHEALELSRIELKLGKGKDPNSILPERSSQHHIKISFVYDGRPYEELRLIDDEKPRDNCILLPTSAASIDQRAQYIAVLPLEKRVEAAFDLKRNVELNLSHAGMETAISKLNNDESIAGLMNSESRLLTQFLVRTRDVTKGILSALVVKQEFGAIKDISMKAGAQKRGLTKRKELK
jgi:hypothetical protein